MPKPPLKLNDTLYVSTNAPSVLGVYVTIVLLFPTLDANVIVDYGFNPGISTCAKITCPELISSFVYNLVCIIKSPLIIGSKIGYDVGLLIKVFSSP
jgi:hypothetical protein